MKIKIVFACTLLYFSSLKGYTQPTEIIFAKNTTAINRSKEWSNLVSMINNNLALALTDSTEENWQDALYAMEILRYRNAYIDNRIKATSAAVQQRSTNFQRAWLELIYTLYNKEFVREIKSFIKQTNDPKLLTICAEYLINNNQIKDYQLQILKRIQTIETKHGKKDELPLFTVLKNKLQNNTASRPPIGDLLNKYFLPGEMVMYSFQRKNRDYPGLVMVRGRDGQFIQANNTYFSVPQLARSNSNMPGYLTNGNTPQGLFKIIGFAVSKSIFIGPTTNIQMVLPYENSGDVTDSVTRSLGNNYQLLLPQSWKNYFPIYEAYYAGKAGRTEIIAHGTTVNPEYYRNQIYYPQTPTAGCLCTKEIWNTADGSRIESDQEKLVQAVIRAGGASGYCLVIELDDEQKPVSMDDVLQLLNQKNEK